MKATETKLSGCFILEPNVFGDHRGYFFESFNKQSFEAATGAEVNFVQDNQSFSSKGVLRGLHAQKGEFAQAKLVRVLQGAVLDVAVDARPNSQTFGQHVAVELSAENKKQLFVPRGFLHGFIVLTDTAEFFYKCDNYYHKDAEWGVKYNDEQLNIEWQMPSELFKLSEKDEILPSFAEAVNHI
ncbi:dTDP-4-dehydrorhamnose 3,5-epimerase [Sphingobacterium sp. PU5-4]|uniref:dTDP-4-dehydrorhamnose 3,5-epimerase n=1 Tax=Sphingobacterium tenebrionis TaxID=3111775 RepID=A0ABU8I1R6_9SPHI